MTLATISLSQSALDKSASELTIAEQQFANDAATNTIKEAFMNVLMEESIVFRPHPMNGRYAYTIDTRPDSAYLFWKPELVSISQGGDFGYSTGPWYAKRGKNSGPIKGFGNFVTIWKKDQHGTWKVILDKGVNYSNLGERKTTLITKLPTQKVTRANVTLEDILAMDSKAFSGNELPMCTEESLFFRHFRYPEKLTDDLKKEIKTYTAWSPINGGLAPYGDMAFSYGTYLALKDGEKLDGYYLRIWTRDTKDHWTIAIDLRTDN